MERQPCVYVSSDGRHATIHIGVTSDLMGRLHQHRTGTVPGFTARGHVKRLVHHEMAETIAAAILREKPLKAWKR